jgi:pimeloyl-ACP methyl ester carboxylesterase
MAAIQDKWVQLSHGRTHYLEAGTGAPVILVHGAGYVLGAYSWLQNMPALSEHFRVLSIDALNFSIGDFFDQEFSFAYMVDHLREFQDALGLKKSHFVGHSMGGWLVTLLAYESPNRIDKLVDVDGGGMLTETLTSMTEWKPPSAEQIAKEIGTRLESAKVPGLNRDAIIKQFVDELTRPDRHVAYNKVMKHMTNGATRQRYNVRRRLPHITVPTQIIWGENDASAVHPFRVAAEVHKLIPNSKLYVVKNCTNNPPFEKPEEFNKVVIDFLKG